MSSPSYITIHDYLRDVTGQNASQLVGNLMRLSSNVVAGATSLPVTPVTTVTLNQYDPVYIFDGASTEIVTVGSAGASVGASSIPISATQYAHISGTSCCSDASPTTGSVGQAIIDASAEVETICYQSLLQATNTNETVDLLSTRAFIDNQSQLWVRTRQFPVQSVSALTIQFAVGNVFTVDTSQVVLPSIGKLIRVPTVKASGSGSNYQLLQNIDPRTSGNVILTYVGGYAYANLPPIIKRAAVLLTSDILSDRFNPTGAASVQMGKRRVDAFLRGDLSGESALVKRARKWLRPFIQDGV